MVLTRGNLVYYLLDRGLISIESVVDGDFMVVDASRRNRNFKVMRRRSPGYFIKQAREQDPQTINAFQNEAGFYRRVHDDPACERLAALIPSYYAFDPDQLILVLGLLTEAENLYEYHRRLGRFPLNVASALGDLTGGLHHGMGARPADWQRTRLSRMIPWILSIHQSFSYPSHLLSEANIDLLDAIQRHPEFAQGLDAARSRWQTDCLIHSDIRLDNWVVAAGPQGENGADLRLIDWEMAALGDPYWDAGAVFAAYLSFWVLSLPVTQAGTFLPSEVFPESPPGAVRDAVQAFWEAYVERTPLTGQAVDDARERTCRYAGARLIQTAFEHLQPADYLTTAATHMLYFSRYLLTEPGQAGQDLLGF